MKWEDQEEPKLGNGGQLGTGASSATLTTYLRATGGMPTRLGLGRQAVHRVASSAAAFRRGALLRLCTMIMLLTALPARGQLFEGRVAIELGGSFDPSSVDFTLWQNGTVTIVGLRTTGPRGLYREGGPLGYSTILEEGQAAPELSGLTLVTGPVGPWVSRDGHSLVAAFLDGPGVTTANDVATWLCSPACELVYREGDPFPPLAGVELGYSPIAPRVNRTGAIAFYATLQGAGAPAGTARAFVAGTPGNLAVVAREGSPAPDRAGENFTGAMFSPEDLAFNDAGEIAFRGSTASGYGAWSGPPSGVRLRAFEGEPAFATGETFSRVDATSLQAGHEIMVHADTAGRRIFADVPVQPRLAAAAGQVIDGGDQLGDFLWRPSVSAWGRVAFLTTSGSDQLIVAEQPGTPGLLTTLAHRGHQAPGLPAGVVFDDFPTEPVINEFHQVAFEAVLAGTGVTAANDRSLWIQDPVFGLVPIAREGSTIHLGPGDDRTLGTIHAAFMTNADRFTRSISNGDNLAFNDRGEVVFRAELTDGSHAVIVTRLFPALIVFEDGFESGTLDGWSASSP